MRVAPTGPATIYSPEADIFLQDDHPAEIAARPTPSPEATAAFELAYRQHAEKLTSLACGIVGAQDGPDALQESIARAYANLHGFIDHGEGLAPWLYTIVRNTSYNYASARARREARETPQDNLTAMNQPSTECSPSTHAIQCEEHAVIVEALSRLKPDHRDALVHLYAYDFPLGEYTALRGLPRGTALSRSHRARAALREALEQLQETA